MATVSGWLADQGVDLGVGDCPNAGSDGIAGLIERLKAGDVGDRVSREELRAGYFLPSAVTVPEMLHILFNGLKEALESSEGWKPFEPILRDLVTTLGSRMWRDRFLGLCMAGAPKPERRLMRSFDGHKFDWRWEVLETKKNNNKNNSNNDLKVISRIRSSKSIALSFATAGTS